MQKPSRDTTDIVFAMESLETRLLEGILELRLLKTRISDLPAIRDAARAPTVPPDDTVTIMEQHDSPYEKEIVAILKETGHRLTFRPLYDAIMARGHKCHEQTVKRYLKSLMLDGIVDNRHDAEPAGYGITEWGA